MPYVALHVKFISFTATSYDKNAMINWTTAQEVNANYFVVERSKDGRRWESAGKALAAKNSGVKTNYALTDYVTGYSLMYYRIKEVNMDGGYSYSETRTVNRAANAAFPINISSTAGNQLIIRFEDDKTDNMVLSLVSLTCEVICRIVTSPYSGEIRINKNNLRGAHILSLAMETISIWRKQSTYSL